MKFKSHSKQKNVQKISPPTRKQTKQEQEQKAEEERIYMENILSGNPLLNLQAHPSLRPISKLKEGGMMMLFSRTVQKV
ncbi:Spliceosome-Associated Protein Cwc15 [Manis pentadactyla]|nr:Spliceosome-Associated Protein Cwc15 [Manis pentadactyla]